MATDGSKEGGGEVGRLGGGSKRGMTISFSGADISGALWGR